MNKDVVTERLVLRALQEQDAKHILELDSQQQVYQFLGGDPIHTMEEAEAVVAHIRRQYEENGTGRWAVIRKADNAFLGWCGIKFVNDRVTDNKTDYFDIGYRFMPRYWGQGFAGEAALACRDYAFNIMSVEVLHATVMEGNIASMRIAERLGMEQTGIFTENEAQWYWYTLRNCFPDAIKEINR